jgi:hypothetical protein
MNVPVNRRQMNPDGFKSADGPPRIRRDVNGLAPPRALFLLA